MNREQMVEKGAWAFQTAPVETYDMTWEDMAITVLDAVLPQVSTMAELEALPDMSALLSFGTQPPSIQNVNHRHKHHLDGWYSLDTQGLLDSLQPLVVVWTPEIWAPEVSA